MKLPAFDYFAPTTVDAALALLAEHGDGAKLLAGGQSLMPALAFRLAFPAVLIDLNRIDTLASPQLTEDPRSRSLMVGAMTRHRAFEISALVREQFPLLHHAVQHIAHVQIRNRGTLGGSLCHADPSAEWPALCLACDARMLIRGPAGEREVRADEFVTGLFTTAVGPGEMLARIEFPAWPAGRRWGFQELARRDGDFAIAGVACTVDLDAVGECLSARIAVFGAGDRARLLDAAAVMLRGRRPGAHELRAAAAAAAAAVDCQSDHHASADYRRQLVEVLTARALAQALAGASGGRDAG